MCIIRRFYSENYQYVSVVFVSTEEQVLHVGIRMEISEAGQK